MSAFLTLPSEVKVKRKNELVAEFDKGKLLCPCYNLPELVKTLEDAFTFFFSAEKSDSFSIQHFTQFLAGIKLHRL